MTIFEHDTQKFLRYALFDPKPLTNHNHVGIKIHFCLLLLCLKKKYRTYLLCNLFHVTYYTIKKLSLTLTYLSILHLQDVVIVVLVKHTLKTTLCVKWTDRLRTLDDYAWVAIIYRTLKIKEYPKIMLK